MKKKEINLLPENAIFDVNKYFLIKKFVVILFFNIIFLLIITFNLILEKKFLNNHIIEQEKKLNKISALVENFKKYEEKSKQLLKKLNYLNKKKKLYYTSNEERYSSFLSIMVLAKCIPEGIRINDLTYAKGDFILKGDADSPDSFYNFYDILNKNKLVKKVSFEYLKLKNNTNFFEFKIKVFIKEIV